MASIPVTFSSPGIEQPSQLARLISKTPDIKRQDRQIPFR
jgi:hypothetical protein